VRGDGRGGWRGIKNLVGGGGRVDLPPSNSPELGVVLVTKNWAPRTAEGTCVDMCWTLVAEEPNRPTTLNLEHYPLKADVSCFIFPRKDEQRTAPEWPRLPLTRDSRATNEHAALPQSPFSFPLYNRKSNARASRLSHL
jgi:hypothetical protein